MTDYGYENIGVGQALHYADSPNSCPVTSLHYLTKKLIDTAAVIECPETFDYLNFAWMYSLAKRIAALSRRFIGVYESALSFEKAFGVTHHHLLACRLLNQLDDPIRSVIESKTNCWTMGCPFETDSHLFSGYGFINAVQNLFCLIPSRDFPGNLIPQELRQELAIDLGDGFTLDGTDWKAMTINLKTEIFDMAWANCINELPRLKRFIAAKAKANRSTSKEKKLIDKKESPVDGLSEDKMNIYWGGREFRLTPTSSRLVEALLRAFDNNNPYVAETYLQTECEFQGSVRNLVRDNKLKDLIVRQMIDGKRINGIWGLVDPEKLKKT